MLRTRKFWTILFLTLIVASIETLWTLSVSRKNIEDSDRCYTYSEGLPRIVTIEIIGFQTFAAKMTRPRKIDLLGQEWTIESEEAPPIISIQGTLYTIHCLAENHIQLRRKNDQT